MDVLDHLAGEIGQKAGLQHRAGAIHPHLAVRGGGQEEKTVVPDPTGLHVPLDDLGGQGDRLAQVGAVGADDESHVGDVQEVEPPTDAEHPLLMIDVQLTLLPAHLGDVADISFHQRKKIVHNSLGHVGAEGPHRPAELVLAGFLQRRHVQGTLPLPVKDQGIFVRLEPADHRIDRLVRIAENLLDLPPDLAGVPEGGVAVEAEAGAPPRPAPFGIMVGDQKEDFFPAAYRLVDRVEDDLSQVRPPQVEHPPQIADRQDDPQGRLRGAGNMDAPVHAFENDDQGRVTGQVLLEGELGFRAGIDGRVLPVEVENPLDPLFDTPASVPVQHRIVPPCGRADDFYKIEHYSIGNFDKGGRTFFAKGQERQAEGGSKKDRPVTRENSPLLSPATGRTGSASIRASTPHRAAGACAFGQGHWQGQFFPA